MERLDDVGRVLDWDAEESTHHAREFRNAERIAGAETARASRQTQRVPMRQEVLGQ